MTPRIARACEDIRLSAEAVLRAERMRRERLTFGVVAHRSQTSSPVRPALAVPTQRPIEFRHEPPAEDVVRDALGEISDQLGQRARDGRPNLSESMIGRLRDLLQQFERRLRGHK